MYTPSMKNLQAAHYAIGGLFAIGLVLAFDAWNSGASNSAAIPTNPAQVMPSAPSPVGAQTSQSATSDLYDRQRDCASRLSQFIQTKSQASTGQYSNASNFVVGYSPSRRTCIGGYQVSVGTPGAQFSLFEIVDLNTNATIASEGNEAIYKATLTRLTDGQL